MTSKDSFELLSAGKFGEALERLSRLPEWRDDNAELGDGPFCLRIPGARGWGEQLLLASLLKRVAVAERRVFRVSVDEQLGSLLARDPAFKILRGNEEGKLRSPLSILRHALLGDLLELDFRPIEIEPVRPASAAARPHVGIAWASINNRSTRIPEKWMHLCHMLNLLEGVPARIVSFQRHIKKEDRKELEKCFPHALRIFESLELDANDQMPVAREISSLDCMVTISTTTAHIAAALGVPVVLLAADRGGKQWFWQAQARHGKTIYPSVHVVLGTSGETWWQNCIEPARRKLLSILNPLR